MDAFELSDAPKPPRKRKTSALVWNVLTILVLVSILCVVSVFLLIYIDPYNNLNPFPPPTMFPTPVLPTFTVTPRFTLVPTWTPTNANPLMVDNPLVTQTPVSVSPGEQLISLVTATPPAGGYAFVPQEGSPSTIAGITFHPDAGCNWTGVGGQATSLNGEAVSGIFVQLGGSMPGNDAVEKLTMTGLAPVYGPGGFEFTLSDGLFATNHTLWIQLLDQQNLPISDPVYFDTFADCQKNLVIIYFDQVR